MNAVVALGLAVGLLAGAAVYHHVVAALLRAAFVRVTGGDHDAFFARIAPAFVYRFAGDNALGGERRTQATMRRWFARLRALFPRVEMDVHEVVVSGWPWDTRAVLHWRDLATPRAGAPVANAGVHVFRLRWGRITRIDAYLDTAKVATACATMLAAGVSEAGGAPLSD